MARKQKTPEQMASAWASAMGDGKTAANYKAGILAYTGNPMAAAATDEAQAAYAAGTAAAVNSGRMKQRLMSANVQTWRDNATGPGVARLASGGSKGKSKAQAAFTRLAPAYAAMRQAADALPKSDGRGRMLAAHDALMAAVGKT